MGRGLAHQMRRSVAGRVATAIAVLAVGMTAAACGSPEPVTATTVSINTPGVTLDETTKRPACTASESFTLSESASRHPLARAASPWGKPTITIEALGDFRLNSVLATEGRELHGFYNLTAPRDMKAGDTILLEARQFTVSPDITATMTQFDSLTPCATLP